jgi:uncharacterized RDD family membrane protein YckC
MEQILDAPMGARTLQYAGFWIRVVAYLIDGVLLYIVMFLLMTIFGIGMFTDPMNIDYGALGTIYAISILTSIGYFAGMESSAKQATLGKMAVGIKVGNENGEKISFMNAVGRLLGKIVSALILYIGFMMAGWDAKKQALHDKMAGTYVFYGK